MTVKGQARRLEEAIKLVSKRFGTSTIINPAGENKFEELEAFSTGSLGLDIATRIGGVPRQRVSVLWGPESGGKTTVALQCVAAAQRAKEFALWIDAEYSFHPKYAQELGVDMRMLRVHQPDYGEQGWEVAETFISKEAVGIVVVDSVAEMRPRADMESNVGDVAMGGRARLTSDAVGKLKTIVWRSNVALVIINQVREKMGGAPMWGPNETHPAGRALKHAASLIVDIRRGKTIKNGNHIVGTQMKFRIAKSKCSDPFQTAVCDLIFHEGISREAEILDFGLQAKVLEKSGTWYEYKGEPVGQGREAARLFLKENPELAGQIEDEIRALLTKLPTEAEAGAVEQEEQ